MDNIEFDKLENFLKSELEVMKWECIHQNYEYVGMKYYEQLLKCVQIARQTIEKKHD